jgi:hypothetical protein
MFLKKAAQVERSWKLPGAGDNGKRYIYKPCVRKCKENGDFGDGSVRIFDNVNMEKLLITYSVVYSESLTISSSVHT